MTLRTFEYPDYARADAWGQLHGSTFRNEIREVADIRLELCTRIGGFRDEAEVLEIAEQHLPVLRAFEKELYDELVGIADGAGVTPARIVVLNHYTDLRDIASSRRAAEVAFASGKESGGCSALYVRARTDDPMRGPLLGQTWDMHASAAPFAMMLKVPQVNQRPAAWLTTITGCVGMAGMNAEGLGITINNLRSLDAKVGVVWPAVVRRALWEPSAAAARDLVVRAPLGSGHHYLVADSHAVYGIETSGERRAVVFDGGQSYIHTNHCFDPSVAEVSEVAPGSSTHVRHDRLAASLGDAPVASDADMWRRLQMVNMRPPAGERHGFATCSAIVMDLGARRVWGAAAGDELVPQELPF